MKKIALVLGFLLVSFGAFAQDKTDVKKSDLKGPEYKNYKPWKHKTETTAVYAASDKTSLTSPEYKNRKPWKETSEKVAVKINTSGTERQKLKGPAYKNYKPWKKKA